MATRPSTAGRRSRGSHTTRRPRRLSASERAIERAERRALLYQLRRRETDPENRATIPWNQVKAKLGL